MWTRAKILAVLWRDQRGATAVEYGLIVSLIVIAMLAAFNSVADSTMNMWNHVSSEVEANT